MAEYEVNVAHLYGDLMNTYGDWGNILALQYYAKKIGVEVQTTLVSLGDEFDDTKYDFVLFGGGQDYEEEVVARDLPGKADNLKTYIENEGVFLGVCGGFQLLGHYMEMANGHTIKGIGVLDHYTKNLNFEELKNMRGERLTGNIQIKNTETGETYHGFENHQGRTYLGQSERALGHIVEGFGNNGDDGTEGVIYKNTYGSYFHGPILTRNGNLAKRMLLIILNKKYPTVDWDEKIKEVPTETF